MKSLQARMEWKTERARRCYEYAMALRARGRTSDQWRANALLLQAMKLSLQVRDEVMAASPVLRMLVDPNLPRA